MKDKNLLAWDEILKPGTRFWTISFYPEEKQIKCPVCKGKGYIKLEGKTYPCPECYGDGFIREKKPAKWQINKKWCTDYWVVTEVKITQTVESDKYRVMYLDDWNGFPAEKVFTSKAKANREVNRLNKAIEEEKNNLVKA
jgi:RecJ-like exonuclease